MLWGGRFSTGLDPLMVSYNQSIRFDRAIYAQDIQASIVYARANSRIGILTPEEFSRIEAGLLQVREEWEMGKFEIREGVDEDIHTANERRLGELIGTETAGKLHTGRSRNDQVATGMRLWLRDKLRLVEQEIQSLLKTLTARAKDEIDVLMPGYTHLQRAQPIRWSHWLLSYGAVLSSDLERLREVTRRVNRSPLGSGALVGNPFGIDRDTIARELGFETVLPNSMAGVADRDFVIEMLQWAATLMSHISRWAEDLIVYSTSEFQFVRLSDAYSTGSSLMPQKKNPDSLELLRGKAGRVFGHMSGLMMTVKGLPSTYNKDLQESFQPMLDTVTTVTDSLRILRGLLGSLTIFPDHMLAALSPDMLATDLADQLVRRGVPFRDTHHISGRVVALAEKLNKGINELSSDELRSVDERLGDNGSDEAQGGAIADCFDLERSVETRTSKGGTSHRCVLEQVDAINQMLG